jgi:hypothetical protein
MVSVLTTRVGEQHQPCEPSHMSQSQSGRSVGRAGSDPERRCEACRPTSRFKPVWAGRNTLVRSRRLLSKHGRQDKPPLREQNLPPKKKVAFSFSSSFFTQQTTSQHQAKDKQRPRQSKRPERSETSTDDNTGPHG